MKHSNSKTYKFSGGVLRSLVLTLALVIIMTATSFADVVVEKEWDDGLTGAKAGSRSAPTVNLEGTTSYEQLLNLMWPVGSYYITESSIDPNTAWGGTWERVENGRFLEATTGSDAGTIVSAGLPNITGEFGMVGDGNNAGVDALATGSGAIVAKNTAGSGSAVAGTGWTCATGFTLNASRSSSIYGNSSTVQPNSVKVYIWKRTA